MCKVCNTRGTEATNILNSLGIPDSSRGQTSLPQPQHYKCPHSRSCSAKREKADPHVSVHLTYEPRGHYLTSFIPQKPGPMVAEAPHPGFPVTSFLLINCPTPSHTHPPTPGLHGSQWSAGMEPHQLSFKKCSHLLWASSLSPKLGTKSTSTRHEGR